MSRKIFPFPLFYPNRPKICRRQPLRSGFTLVELLIAVSIFSAISLAIFSTFSSGASILRRVKDINFPRQRILLKAQRLARELREQPNYKKKLFQGSNDKVSFAGSQDYFPSRITYYFDSSRSSLMRCADRLDTIITAENTIDPELKASPEVFISQVKELKFYYFYLDLLKNQYSWTEEWPHDYLPIAVRFTIITENQNYDSTVFLPTA